MKRLLFVAALAAATLSRAAAQGTLSTQGYGYPAGPLSSRGLAMGGSVGELDPISSLNPAALTTWGRSGLYGQFGPEFRTVKTDGFTEQSTVIRFPLFVGAINASDKLVFGLSFSNLLDRTWATATSGYYHLVDGDSVAYAQNFASSGAITNVRFAAGYRLSNRLRVGLGIHFLSGINSLKVFETFADTGFASFQQITTVNLYGSALSAGVAWSPVPQVAIGLSGQLGGVMNARRNDTLVTSARVPNRAGASLLYAGIAGVVIAADGEWTRWSSMNGLAQSTILAVDTWDYGAGAEIHLASVGGGELPLRLGIRKRTLPFQADSATVKETLFSVGVGIPVSLSRGRFDLSLIRALRSAPVSPSVKESGWILSIGILVRP